MDTSGTRDFNCTHRNEPRGTIDELDPIQRIFNRLLLERARTVQITRFLPALSPYHRNSVRQPFVSPAHCRLTGGVTRGIVDPKEDPYDEYDD